MLKAHHGPDVALADASGAGVLTPFARRAMLAEERRAALSNLRLISALAAVMVPCFVALDYYVYPELLPRFVLLRVLCTAGILILFALTCTRFGKRYFRGFTIALPLIPAVFISIMIFETRDPATPYYAGLTLCVVAIGFLFHWTYREALVVSAAVLLLYLAASAPALAHGMASRTAAGAVNNIFFLIAKGIVIVAGSVAHHRYRVREFMVRERLRQEKNQLRQQRKTLQRTLRDLKATEGQLIQSEKMASLGLLGAGVIHEIGNPLNYSNQALFMLRKQLPQDAKTPQVEEALSDMQEGYDRISEIVRELRDFSQKTTGIDIDYQLAESINAAVRMLRKEIEESGTRVVLDLDEDLRIEAVRNQVTQVLINLIHNAIQAMAKSCDEENREVRVTSRQVGDEAVVSVRDNGPGIECQSLRRVFDPFFTTKEPGEGTGLGLSICYRIVEAHGGRIEVESESGSFTEFTVRLPLPKERSVEPVPAEATTQLLPHSHEQQAFV